MILGLHHVQVSIPPGEENRARKFYCDFLGLSELPKPAALQARGGFWVSLGDRELHVGVDSAPIDRAASKAHVAYEVEDAAHWRKKLLEAGIVPIESVPIPGYLRFEARDPFGNRIEFIQRI